jgi:hypothetical protein
MFNEIIITILGDNFHQIAFLKDGIYIDVEPYEAKYHSEYLNLDITTFKMI